MKYIVIGTVTNTQGIRGELRVKTDSDFKEDRYAKGSELYINHPKERRKVTVLKHREKGDMDIVAFEEIDSIDVAEKYKGCTLEVADEDRNPLEDDEFYFDDLNGLEVLTDNKSVGTVEEVLEMPQGAMLRVRRSGKKDALIPFLKVFIEDVDLDEGKIKVKEIEGLL